MFLRFFVAAWLLGVVVACGQPAVAIDGGVVDAGTPDASAGDAGVFDAGADAGFDAGRRQVAAFAAWCSRMANTPCDMLVACGLNEPSTCDGGTEAMPTSTCLVAAALIDAGTASFDEAAGQRCLDHLKGACSLLGPRLGDCQQVVSGQAPTGGACSSLECGPSDFCDFSGATCPGTCRPRIDAGVLPPRAGACALGTLSNGVTPCEPPLPAGANCLFDAGQAFLPCAEHLGCVSSADGRSATCLPLADAGTACTATTRCELGAGCALVNGATVCARSAGLGEACGPFPDLGVQGPNCRVGLACSTVDTLGHCEALHGAGGNCHRVDDCAAPLTCLLASGTCGPAVPLGGTCNGSVACVAGSVCVQSVCTVQPTGGQACTTKTGCAQPWSCSSDGHCRLPEWRCTP